MSVIQGYSYIINRQMNRCHRNEKQKKNRMFYIGNIEYRQMKRKDQSNGDFQHAKFDVLIDNSFIETRNCSHLFHLVICGEFLALKIQKDKRYHHHH